MAQGGLARRVYGKTVRKEQCDQGVWKGLSCMSPEGCGIDYECFRKEAHDFKEAIIGKAKGGKTDKYYMVNNADRQEKKA